MGELSVLADGTIRLSEGTKNYVEFSRASWGGTTTTARTNITNWLTTNKMTGWTVTVTSMGSPPNITVISNSTRTL